MIAIITQLTKNPAQKVFNLCENSGLFYSSCCCKIKSTYQCTYGSEFFLPQVTHQTTSLPICIDTTDRLPPQPQSIPASCPAKNVPKSTQGKDCQYRAPRFPLALLPNVISFDSIYLPPLSSVFFIYSLPFHLCRFIFDSAFTAQRILVDLARPFWAHSFAEGRITSLA